MAASTLALGQASYELLDALGPSKAATVRRTGSTATLQASRRGGEISEVGIFQTQGSAVTTINVTDRSANLFYSDSGDTNSSINLLASSNTSTFEFGDGNNRFNAARDLINSKVTSHGGNDTVRIGGNASGSFVSTGDGTDQFTANQAATGLDVVMGEGDDTALFLGTLTAGANTVTPVNPTSSVASPIDFPINDGLNIVDMGQGNDRATFLGGVRGGVPGDTGYELQLGAGNDTAVFGPNSTSDGFVLNTGTGSDNITLGRNTTNAVLDLGWDNGGKGYEDNPDLNSLQGDLVVLGVGATLADSVIRSGQSQDILRLAGTITDTSLDLGWGGSLVEVDGSAEFGTTDTTAWDLGGGNDTLTFGELSSLSLLGDGAGFISLGTGADELNLLGTGYGGFGAIEFDLGDDDDADTIVFGVGSSYSGITISNFGYDDVLFIGAGSYGYGYKFLNDDANEFDLDEFRLSGNVIWKQLDDGDSIDQDIMTLDIGNFQPMMYPVVDGEDNVVMTPSDTHHETSLDDGTVIDYIVKDKLDTLNASGAWPGSGSSPMSEDPTIIALTETDHYS